MFPLAKVCTKDRPKTSRAVIQYHKVHLQSAREGGAFLDLDGYLNHEGRVVPVIANRRLWEMVGLQSGEIIPPGGLLFKLCQGRSAEGNQLVNTRVFRGYRETILTMPCELSVALKDHPHIAASILRQMFLAYLEYLESIAVCLRSGGIRAWGRATTLSLAYLHALSDEGEHHFHAHVLTFGPALLPSGDFQTYENCACVRMFHRPGGVRELMAEVMKNGAAHHGYKVTFLTGKASSTRPNGATVRCPDGGVIGVSTVYRVKGAEILFGRAIKAQLGVPPPTVKELELLLSNRGQNIHSLHGHKLKSSQIYKFAMLGFTDSQFRIKEDLRGALQHLETALAVAQASLEDLRHAECDAAAILIQNRREHLHGVFCTRQTPIFVAKVKWLEKFEGTLEAVSSQVHGLSAEVLHQEILEMLFLLERAGYLESSGKGRKALFHLSPLGDWRCRLAQRERALAETSFKALAKLILEPPAAPEVILGRLHMAGVQVRNDRMLFSQSGRWVGCGDLLKSIGHHPALASVPDRAWWQWMHEQREHLPIMLRNSLLDLNEVGRRWSWLAPRRVATSPNPTLDLAATPPPERTDSNPPRSDRRRQVQIKHEITKEPTPISIVEENHDTKPRRR